MTSLIGYIIIGMVLILCGYSAGNPLGYTYAGLVAVLFFFGEVIFGSPVFLIGAGFLLFVYIFSIILKEPNEEVIQDEQSTYSESRAPLTLELDSNEPARQDSAVTI